MIGFRFVEGSVMTPLAAPAGDCEIGAADGA
jgi:hypothetical protein